MHHHGTSRFHDFAMRLAVSCGNAVLSARHTNTTSSDHPSRTQVEFFAMRNRSTTYDDHGEFYIHILPQIQTIRHLDMPLGLLGDSWRCALSSLRRSGGLKDDDGFEMEFLPVGFFHSHSVVWCFSVLRCCWCCGLFCFGNWQVIYYLFSFYFSQHICSENCTRWSVVVVHGDDVVHSTGRGIPTKSKQRGTPNRTMWNGMSGYGEAEPWFWNSIEITHKAWTPPLAHTRFTRPPPPIALCERVVNLNWENIFI